jgi:carbon storage regulator CsrA
MLVLTRHKNESIVIQGRDFQIIIETLKVQGGKVTLGIAAPDEVLIDRAEIAARRREEARGAA